MIPYYTAIWAIGYAEAIYEDVYLPMPSEHQYTKGMSTKSILHILTKENPEISFDHGISENDLLQNAITTETISILQNIDILLLDLDRYIRNTGNQASFLRGYLRYLRPIHPDFRMSGDDGCLTELKCAVTSVKGLSKLWLRNVKAKLDFLKDSDAVIVYPTASQDMLLTGLPNEKTYFAGLSVSLNLRNLTSVLIGQYQKQEIFLPDVGILHSCYGDFTRAYGNLLTTYELRMDHTRVCGFEYVSDWVLLQNSLENLLSALSGSYYYGRGGDGHYRKVRGQGVQGNLKDLQQVLDVQRPETYTDNGL